jgi:hypothetical protein
MTPRARRGKYFAAALLAPAISMIAGDQGSADLSWQDEIAKNLVPYHQLTVEDFQVDDHKHPESDYTVKTFIDPQYHYLEHLSDNGIVRVYVADWTIFSGLDKNDTVRKSSVRDMKQRLPYAQALFDLGEIRARELAALTPAQLPSAQGDTAESARANLDAKVKALCAEKFGQARAGMTAFEKATRKGNDRNKVRQLAGEIRKRLDALPPVQTPTPGPSSSPAAAPSASPAAR